MSETKHTPGPWKATYSNAYVDRSGGSGQWLVEQDDPNAGRLGGDVIASVERYGEKTTEANARLIAAAPDLLAVALRYEQWEANLVENNRAWDTASGLPRLTQELYDEFIEIQSERNAAIKKARGEAISQ